MKLLPEGVIFACHRTKLIHGRLLMARGNLISIKMDLVILIFLIYYIGKMAQQQGLNALKWRSRFALAWVIADLVVAGTSWYLTNSFTTASISGFLAAILAALIVFQAFKKEAAGRHHGPDKEKEDNL